MTLSTKPPVFDPNDPAGTLKNICTYLHNLQEELDFLLKQLSRQRTQ